MLSVDEHFNGGRGWREERQTKRELFPNKSLVCCILVTDDIRFFSFLFAILVSTGSGGMGGMGMGGGGGGMPDGFNFDDFDKVSFLLLNVFSV